MPTGTVTWFGTIKGFGFVTPEQGSPDVFVHVSALEQAGLHGLSDGQHVSYELEQNRQGRTPAASLRVL